MHVVEIERSLRQLHLSGMAAVLETRLLQAGAGQHCNTLDLRVRNKARRFAVDEPVFRRAESQAATSTAS
jgi:hypothetical protein